MLKSAIPAWMPEQVEEKKEGSEEMKKIEGERHCESCEALVFRYNGDAYSEKSAAEAAQRSHQWRRSAARRASNRAQAIASMSGAEGGKR